MKLKIIERGDGTYSVEHANWYMRLQFYDDQHHYIIAPRFKSLPEAERAIGKYQIAWRGENKTVLKEVII